MKDRDQSLDPASALLDAQGQPIAKRRAAAGACPRCGAGRERRRLSAGFGPVHDVCGKCGYDFPESTV